MDSDRAIDLLRTRQVEGRGHWEGAQARVVTTETPVVAQLSTLLEGPADCGFVAFESHGARVAVRVSQSWRIEDVWRVLPVGSRRRTTVNPDVTFHLAGPGGAATEGAFQLRLESRILQSSSNTADLLERLRSELHFQVARHARSALFVHAGVVGWAGRAILIPGRSRTGKTSLVAALARAGADYYSDEYAVVDAEGWIHPYAKPLSVRGDSDVATRHEIRDLGFRTGSEPLRAGLIVSTSYQTEAGFRPRHGSRGQGLLHLIDNTIVVRERPRAAMEHLTPVALAAALVEGTRGDSDEAAAYLLHWCSQQW